MKKILFALLLISSFASAQVPALNEIVATSTPSAAKIAAMTKAMQVYNATGTDDYTVSISVFGLYSGSATYAEGDIFKIIFPNTNTTADVTINISSEGVKDVIGFGVGDIEVGKPYELYYNGTSFIVMNNGGGGGGSGAAWGSITGTLSSQTDLQSALDVKTPTSRTISTTAPLSGGGDLSSNRTLTITNAAADGSTKGAASFTANDFDATSGNISIDYANGQAASGSVNGFVTTGTQTIAGVKTFSGANVYGTPASITLTNATGLPGSTGITGRITESNLTAAYLFDVASISTAGGTVTLDMNNQNSRAFYGSASFSTPKTLAMSNIVSGKGLFQVVLSLTDLAAVLTVPGDWQMADIHFDGSAFTPSETGAYIFGGTLINSVWYVNVAGPYN